MLYSLCMHFMLLAILETLRLSMFSQRRLSLIALICAAVRKRLTPACCCMCLMRQTVKEMGHKGRVIIKTSDTDVIVLYVHYFPQMKNTAELWIQMGNVSFVFFSLRHHLQSYICCPCCIRMRHNFIFLWNRLKQISAQSAEGDR